MGGLTMAQLQPIEAVSFALSGTTMCVAAIRELWAKPNDGDAFAVHSIIDETTDDLPFYCVYVTDYKGNRYGFETLTRESQCELCDFAIDELF